jgi:hypothetical protein
MATTNCLNHKLIPRNEISPKLLLCPHIKWMHDSWLDGSKIKLSLWQALEAYLVEMLRIPHCIDNQLTDGGRLCALPTGSALLPRNIISLLLVLISVRVWVNHKVQLEELDKLKKCIHLIRSQNRNLPACSIVPTLPYAPWLDGRLGENRLGKKLWSSHDPKYVRLMTLSWAHLKIWRFNFWYTARISGVLDGDLSSCKLYQVAEGSMPRVLWCWGGEHSKGLLQSSVRAQWGQDYKSSLAMDE